MKPSKTLLVLYLGDDWHLRIPGTAKIQHAYAVWQALLARRGIQLARASIQWFKGDSFSRYWLLQDDGTWLKVNKRVQPILVEDRCKGFDPKTGLLDIKTYLRKLEIARHVPILNYPEFTDLVDNKLNQAVVFYPYMPSSILRFRGDVVDNPEKKVIVLKNLGGFGGDYVTLSRERRVKVDHLQLQQTFIDAKKRNALKDTRIVFIGSKPVYAFQRTAKKGSLHTNIHLGGSFEFIPLSTIKALVIHAKKVGQPLEVFPKRTFSLDFMVDQRSNTPFLIECNTKPTIEPLTGERAKTYFETLAEHFLS